ncbi:hypothetical protein [Natronococcus occultus]|uniref:Uncharacterized protein n=1 Tax=Natronococcus occultus SP4 TaxID=694430 RepID=L0JZ72_9EURY|nr:hypothetical protein [Natronococcus occultus]AGB38061.1 hypothetical protein Natoc_2283 [Natronococcus occultus SP4]
MSESVWIYVARYEEPDFDNSGKLAFTDIESAKNWIEQNLHSGYEWVRVGDWSWEYDLPEYTPDSAEIEAVRLSSYSDLIEWQTEPNPRQNRGGSRNASDQQ